MRVHETRARWRQWQMYRRHLRSSLTAAEGAGYRVSPQSRERMREIARSAAGYPR